MGGSLSRSHGRMGLAPPDLRETSSVCVSKCAERCATTATSPSRARGPRVATIQMVAPLCTAANGGSYPTGEITSSSRSGSTMGPAVSRVVVSPSPMGRRPAEGRLAIPH